MKPRYEKVTKVIYSEIGIELKLKLKCIVFCRNKFWSYLYNTTKKRFIIVNGKPIILDTCAKLLQRIGIE